ncbi:MAG: PilX N-terminal domain-containing pilus assembly protein [Rhodoferax sp.]|nr:PilX N-terminal domain-containing pilus assembly protein [Rhodoferax sp.]
MCTQIHPSLRSRSQHGASLIMVMLILVVVSLLGVGGAQIAVMSERGARSDRDHQVAWQAAEAALSDAEFDLIDSTSTRKATVPFDGKTPFAITAGCGTSGTSVGLCALTLTGHPAWLDADYTDTSASAPTTKFGTFTSRTFAAGSVGIQPAQAPRYVMEMVADPNGDKSNPEFLYRVTAVGFGPRVDIQVMLQMLYRI